MKDFFIGIFCLGLGILFIINAYKFPDKERPTGEIRVWIGGIGLIVVGIMYILGMGS